jgi:hypothetical protein
VSSTDHMVWFVAMAILIPAIVHGGTTWAYFRGKQEMSSRPAKEAAEPRHPGRDEAHRTESRSAAPLAPSTIDDGRVPEKQIWRWHDDGGAVTR